MRTKVLLLIVGLLIAGVGLIGVMAAPANASCTLNRFEAVVREGRSTGTIYVGRLTLEADADGGLTGLLEPSDGTAGIRVAGQADGHAINLAFDLGTDAGGSNQHYLFAVGTLWNSFGQCSGAMGGPLRRPAAG